MLFRRKNRPEPAEDRQELEAQAPKKTGYSEIYRTREGLYRYNYDTGHVEKLKKVIRQTNVNGIFQAMVHTVVESSFEVKQKWFDEGPEYWISTHEETEAGE